jgi:two-component system, OmpR family, sensor histidine kinase MprB
VSFRRRLTLLTAVAVAVAVLVAAVGAYIVVRGQLRAEVDSDLRQRATAIADFVSQVPVEPPVRLPRPAGGNRLGGPAGYIQFVRSDGETVRMPDDRVPLPVSADALAVAQQQSDAFLTDAYVDGDHLRILTAPLSDGGAVQIARPLDEIDQVLARIRLLGGAAIAGGIALAALLGWLATRTALSPIERLTDASEHVATTRDLTRRIDARGSDEIARLASSFNTMLDALEHSHAALDASLVAQRQLIADASHELRTPLTSVRTNIELLRDAPTMPAEQRHELLEDVSAQMTELTSLVADLIELARGDQPLVEPDDVRFDQLVEEAVARARLHTPQVTFVTSLEPTLVEGVPERLARAVRNLLDNAAKFSLPNGTVEVTLADGELRVRDHGPGVKPDDLPHIFDRFYRSAEARAVPGSGLGLAIVRQVTAAHGGTVSAESADGDGTCFVLALPATAPADPPVPERPARA